MHEDQCDHESRAADESPVMNGTQPIVARRDTSGGVTFATPYLNNRRYPNRSGVSTVSVRSCRALIVNAPYCSSFTNTRISYGPALEKGVPQCSCSYGIVHASGSRLCAD
jgi:hypothetical protein